MESIRLKVQSDLLMRMNVIRGIIWDCGVSSKVACNQIELLFEILKENLQILNVERDYTSCIQFGMGLCSEISPFQYEKNKMALSWKILRINSESGSHYLPDDKAAFCVLLGICHRLRWAPQRPELELEKGAIVIEKSLESNPIFDERDWSRLNAEE